MKSSLIQSQQSQEAPQQRQHQHVSIVAVTTKSKVTTLATMSSTTTHPASTNSLLKSETSSTVGTTDSGSSSTSSTQEQRDDQQQQQSQRLSRASTLPRATTTSTQSQQDLLPQLLERIHDGEWRQATDLLEADPSLARRKVSMVIQGENSNCLLAHLVCGMKDTPVSVVDMIVTFYPSCLLQPDQRGSRLPIHMAVLKDASIEIVQYLCQARPQALQHKDQEGNLPLHYACMHGTAPVLQLLVTTYPQGSQVVNTRDRFPIHLVCDRCFDTANLPTALVEELIRAHPTALTNLDRFGRTPLHLAASVQHPQLSLIQLLIQYDSTALLIKDKARKTPLVCAKREKHSHRHNNHNPEEPLFRSDLVVASLVESTQTEQRKRRQQKFSKFFVTGVMGKTTTRRLSKSSTKDEDLYCCYG